MRTYGTVSSDTIFRTQRSGGGWFSAADGTAAATATMAASIAGGTIAVVAPDAMVDDVSAALTAAGIDHARATRSGIITGITVVPVSVVKGLELDGVVVVEPAAIVAGELQGLRALYVALTRSTRQLTVVHALPLPTAMR